MSFSQSGLSRLGGYAICTIAGPWNDLHTTCLPYGSSMSFRGAVTICWFLVPSTISQAPIKCILWQHLKQRENTVWEKLRDVKILTVILRAMHKVHIVSCGERWCRTLPEKNECGCVPRLNPFQWHVISTYLYICKISWKHFLYTYMLHEHIMLVSLPCSAWHTVGAQCYECVTFSGHSLFICKNEGFSF